MAGEGYQHMGADQPSSPRWVSRECRSWCKVAPPVAFLNRYSAWVQWQSGTARLLPRLIGGRTSGPLFLAQALDERGAADGPRSHRGTVELRRVKGRTPACPPDAVGSLGPEHRSRPCPGVAPERSAAPASAEAFNQVKHGSGANQVNFDQTHDQLGVSKTPALRNTEGRGYAAFPRRPLSIWPGGPPASVLSRRLFGSGGSAARVAGLRPVTGPDRPEARGADGRSSPCARRHARGPARPPMGAPG